MSDRDSTVTGMIVGDDPLPDGRTLVFRGGNAIECENFIRAVRLIALASGKEDDDRWMLHFATARLSGRAMRWHARLDREVRRDWDLLVQALLDEYPVDDDGSIRAEWHSSLTRTSVPPTPAASAVPNPSTSLPNHPHPLGPGVRTGRIRIIPAEGLPSCIFISKALQTTLTMSDALQVLFVESDQPHEICMLDRGQVVNIGNLLCVDWSGVAGTRQGLIRGPLYGRESGWIAEPATAVWNVCPDWTIKATWKRVNESPNFEMSTLAVALSGGAGTFVEDYDQYTNRPGYGHYKARLIFDPIYA